MLLSTILLLAGSVWRCIQAGQAFRHFLSHNTREITVGVSTEPRQVAILTDTSLGTALTVEANPQGKVIYRSTHDRAAMGYYVLGSEGMVTEFKLLSRSTFHCLGDRRELLALLPRTAEGDETAEEFLRRTGFYQKDLTHSQWITNLSRKDEFAVVAFMYDSAAARGEVGGRMPKIGQQARL